MSNAMRADSLRHAIIYAVVLGPVAHVVVTGVVDAARLTSTLGNAMRNELLVRLVGFPVWCFHFVGSVGY